MNMISNALKFTFKGHIGVYLTLLDDEEEVQAQVPDENLPKDDTVEQGTFKDNDKNLEKGII
jgi:signal transduction histidine kinase